MRTFNLKITVPTFPRTQRAVAKAASATKAKATDLKTRSTAAVKAAKRAYVKPSLSDFSYYKLI